MNRHFPILIIVFLLTGCATESHTNFASRKIASGDALYVTKCQYETTEGHMVESLCPVVACKLSSKGVVGVKVDIPGQATPCQPSPSSQVGALGCVFNGKLLPDGEPIAAYNCQTGEKEMRKCINGTLTGRLLESECSK
jgi:hypothetical protein